MRPAVYGELPRRHRGATEKKGLPQKVSCQGKWGFSLEFLILGRCRLVSFIISNLARSIYLEDHPTVSSDPRKKTDL